MNTGSNWTSRRASPRLQVTPQKPSHKAFVWIVVLVLVAGGVASYRVLSSANDSSSKLVQTATKKRDLATAQYNKLKARLDQEATYRAYAQKATGAMIKTGQTDFTGIPGMNQWPHNDPSKLDAIVNKQHPIYPLNFSPQLVSITCGNGDVAEMVPAAKDDLTQMCQAAATAGAPLNVTSTFRSYSEQLQVYHWWAVNGVSGADSDSARPGYSEHQLGLSIDFATANGIGLEAFSRTSQYAWLQANAWKYGFVQRYTTANEAITGYDAEVWHYRYLGRTAAAQYVKSGALSLEQFWGVSGGTYTTAVLPPRS